MGGKELEDHKESPLQRLQREHCLAYKALDSLKEVDRQKKLVLFLDHLKKQKVSDEEIQIAFGITKETLDQYISYARDRGLLLDWLKFQDALQSAQRRAKSYDKTSANGMGIETATPQDPILKRHHLAVETLDGLAFMDTTKRALLVDYLARSGESMDAISKASDLRPETIRSLRSHTARNLPVQRFGFLRAMDDVKYQNHSRNTEPVENVETPKVKPARRYPKEVIAARREAIKYLKEQNPFVSIARIQEALNIDPRLVSDDITVLIHAKQILPNLRRDNPYTQAKREERLKTVKAYRDAGLKNIEIKRRTGYAIGTVNAYVRKLAERGEIPLRNRRGRPRV